ncbi:hypothetical protein [Ancylomarina sp.]|uniref:hypothetical protein n=1 Tax=Ancylomarina sp. TaxID=1970196 RepID=UPI0035684A60
MKKDEIVEIYNSHLSQDINDFFEAIIEKELLFNSESLQNVYPSEQEMGAAIERAMRICYNVGIPLEKHFRIRYVANHNQHTVTRVWKMSKAAYCLTLINGDLDNLLVSRMQWELINKMLTEGSK